MFKSGVHLNTCYKEQVGGEGLSLMSCLKVSGGIWLATARICMVDSVDFV